MCTAAAYRTDSLYFGRTLDYESSYGEDIVVMPRNFKLEFCSMPAINEHYAVIGTAHVMNGYPLFYDAANEKGLCMAGLNFVGNAHYFKNADGKDNIAQFELIPWILGKCADVSEAEQLISRINITDTPFCDGMPVGQLHWIIADSSRTIVVESTADGIHVYDDPANVLTNNPPFPAQMFKLNDFMHLSPKQPQNKFSGNIPMTAYSRGMGALGLPGDLSSQSRFVRAAFVCANSVSDGSEMSDVSQFFHILGAVDQQRGCCEVADGKFEITIYTSCFSAKTGIYYYTSYYDHQITAVDMNRENLGSDKLACYPMVTGENVKFQN